jgi:hypothetical protein
MAALQVVGAFSHAPVEFYNPRTIIAAEKMRQRPDRSIRMVRAAATSEASPGKGVKLIFELTEPSRMMNLTLRVPHRNRFGPDRLAAACRHKAHWHVPIRGLYGGAYHLPTEVAFCDDTIGAILMKRGNRAPAPSRRRFAA